MSVSTPIPTRWCLVCGADHGGDQRCPGEVRCTGPETDTWRVTVETPRGFEGYGVLLAPAGPKWRARILTYPKMLWAVPGGNGGSIKFVGRTSEEAEMKARNFVRAHCARKGYVMHDEIAPFDAPPQGTKGDPRAVQRHPRVARALPVKFGQGRPETRGTTSNLSEGGLFVVTTRPAAEGDQLGLLLQLEQGMVPLRGSVVWRRPYPGPSCPAGMGLKLLDPPKVYRRYICALA